MFHRHPLLGLGIAVLSSLFLGAVRVEAAFDLGICTIESGGTSAAQRTQTVQRIVDSHFSWVRVDVVWTQIEPSGPTVDLNSLSAYDDYINKLNAAGIKIVVVNGTIPSWAADSANAGAAKPDAFATYMSFLADHYKGKVNAYQIFNEVNTSSNWTATSYANVLKAAYPAIKTADPAALVVFSGLAYWYTTSEDFLTGVYGQGAGTSFDVVAMHLYPIAGQDLGAKISAVRNVMTSKGDSAKKMWITEIGATTATGSYSESGQASYTTYLDTLRAYSYIEHVFWYELIDHDNAGYTQAQNDAETEYRFGLYHVDGTAKPIVQQIIDFTAPIATWRWSSFGSFQNSGTGANLAIPAKDGIPNLLRYATGLSATTHSGHITTTQIQKIANLDTLTVTFVHNTAATDVAYSIEAADSPSGPWTAIDPLAAANQTSAQNNTPSAGLQTITVKDIKALSSAVRLMRLRVGTPIASTFSYDFNSLNAGSLGTQGGWTTQSTYASPNVAAGPGTSLNTTKGLGGTNSGTSLAYNSTLFSPGTISSGTVTLSCDIYYAGYTGGEYETFGIGNTYSFYGSGSGEGPTFGIFASGAQGKWGIRPANTGTIISYTVPTAGHWYTVQSVWTLNGAASTGTLSVKDLTAGEKSFTQLASGVALGIISSDMVGAWNTVYVRASPSTSGGYLDNLAFTAAH